MFSSKKTVIQFNIVDRKIKSFQRPKKNSQKKPTIIVEYSDFGFKRRKIKSGHIELKSSNLV